MKKVQASRAEQEAVAPAPTVAVVEPPRVREKPVAPKESSFEAERRALLAEAAPFVKPVIDQLVAEGFVGEDAWLAELERQIASYNPLPGSYVPIAAGSRNSR
jgi:hypothetical protein